MVSGYLKILLFGVFAAFCWDNTLAENIKVFSPRFIPVNSSFDISIIASNRFPEADNLEFYLILDERVALNKIELRTIDISLKLPVTQTYLKGELQQAYKTLIDFRDSTIKIGDFFQLMLNLKVENSLQSNLKFLGVFKKGNKVLGYLKSRENQDPLNNFIDVNLNFYRPQRNAGRALLLNNNSILELNLTADNVNQLLTEFWFRGGLNNSVLKIINKKTGEADFDININRYQMISVTPKNGTQSFIQPWFISRKAWYHISILFSFTDNAAYFYCNGNLISRNDLVNILSASDLLFRFQAEETDNPIHLDQLRIIEFNNSIDVSFRNRNHKYFISDSSRVLAQYNFDNNNVPRSVPGIVEIQALNTQLNKSDAPIFARAPDLNVTVLSNSYELTWSGGDYRQTESYVLEKSIQNADYIPVFTVLADNTYEKTYAFIDAKEHDSDIVHYRVKQIHTDGSFIYSAQVKIGQGETSPFVLEQNYPNPFNPLTSIIIELLEDSEIDVLIYNLEGREIIRLHSGFLSKGIHKFSFDGTELPSGVYLYKVSTPTYSQIKKMVLSK